MADGGRRPPPQGEPGGPPGPTGWRSQWPWLLLLALLVGAIVVGSLRSQPPSQSFDYSQFLAKVSSGQVSEVTIASTGDISGKLKNGQAFTTVVPTGVGETGLIPVLEKRSVRITATGSGGSLWSVLLSLLPWVALIGLFLWFGNRSARQLAAGGAGGFGRSRARIIEAERPSTTFSDVAGYEEVKREVAEVVGFLADPERYRKVGAVLPKGILLVGPPGTGKTLLARAVAGEAGVPFLSVTASSFMEMFVGVGASRVRDLFTEARKRAPAIVFIDEIDAIGGRRGIGIVGGHEERGQTLDQLLAEMDGFDPAVGVVVLSATNRPDVLDPALLRPGRFDRQVVVPLPNRDERLAILRVHTRGKPLADGVDLDVVARGTPGFSGADLANLVNEAAIFAVRGERTAISAHDLSDARDRVLLGVRRSASALLPAERHAVAVHEAGHAVVAALSSHGDPVAKVSILPAGQALGVTEQLPVDDRHLYSEGYLYDSLAIRLGGRAAERLVLGEVSTGASDDLAGATQLAIRMVRDFGMSRELGPVGYASGSAEYLGAEMPASRPYAEETQRAMDEEVGRLLREAEERARSLLTEQRDAITRLAQLLVDEETVDGARVYELLGVPAREVTAGAVGARNLARPATRSAGVVPPVAS